MLISEAIQLLKNKVDIYTTVNVDPVLSKYPPEKAIIYLSIYLSIFLI